MVPLMASKLVEISLCLFNSPSHSSLQNNISSPPLDLFLWLPSELLTRQGFILSAWDACFWLMSSSSFITLIIIKITSRFVLTIYRSLVAPYLAYGLMAWGQACKSYLEKLLKLQKRALRFIYFSERNQHTISLFIDVGVLPLKFLYYEILANLRFEIRPSNAPGTFKISFKIFLMIILIILDPLPLITFTHKVPDSQIKWTHF